MKFLIVISLMAIIGTIMAEPVDEKPKLNMQQVEQLLEQIEKDEQRLSPKPNAAKNDETVTVALQQLFTQFRQLTGAYVDVLNAVNKQLGLPKYPKLPGIAQRTGRGIRDTAPFKQLIENVEQLGTTISEVGELVTRTVSTIGDDSRKTVLRQFQQFADLWSNQLNEISRMFEPSVMMTFNELQGREESNFIDEIQRQVQQLARDIQRYVDSFVADIRNRVSGVRNQIFPNGERRPTTINQQQ